MSNDARRKRMIIICRVVFLIYVFGVVYFLFFCDHYGRTMQFETLKYNFVPFEEIRRYLQNYEAFTMELFIANIAGNVCLFVPFGAMLFAWKGRSVGFFEVTVWSLGFSVLVESIQLISRVGVCDIDDVILNTLGGMLGYLIYLLARSCYRRYIHVKWKEEL